MKTACIQMDSGTDIKANIDHCCELVTKAVRDYGVHFVVTPENTDFVRGAYADMFAGALSYEDHFGISRFAELAKDLNIWLQIGSMTIKNQSSSLSNRSFFFDPEGQIVATYDKIHMFEVTLDNGESYREADAFAAGDRAVVINTPWAGVGLSTCYDIRFPHLYRELAHHGAQVITVPSAFTVKTGQAHWEVLLRARAIENGCYIVAAGQGGMHDGEKKTYGHSMIVGPWGDILVQADDIGAGIIVADLDLDTVTQVRRSINSLEHDRDYTVDVYGELS